MKILLYLLAIIALSAGCSQTNDCGCVPPPQEEVEFYLLKSYDIAPGSYSTIANAKIEEEPLIRFSEIEQYDDVEYEFTLKRSAIDRIKTFQQQPVAFAVTVGKSVIYAGFFRQSFLSSSCDCIRVDPQSGLLNSNKIWVELGYAPTRNLSDIDERNNETLLAALARAGKLK